MGGLSDSQFGEYVGFAAFYVPLWCRPVGGVPVSVLFQLLTVWFNNKYLLVHRCKPDNLHSKFNHCTSLNIKLLKKVHHLMRAK